MKFSWLTKYIYLMFVGFMAIIILSLSVFLYKNFYQTIAHSKRIIILRREVALHTIDIDQFNKIIEKIKEKGRAEGVVDWQKFKNPFSSY